MTIQQRQQAGTPGGIGGQFREQAKTPDGISLTAAPAPSRRVAPPSNFLRRFASEIQTSFPGVDTVEFYQEADGWRIGAAQKANRSLVAPRSQATTDTVQKMADDFGPGFEKLLRPSGRDPEVHVLPMAEVRHRLHFHEALELIQAQFPVWHRATFYRGQHGWQLDRLDQFRPINVIENPAKNITRLIPDGLFTQLLLERGGIRHSDGITIGSENLPRV